MKPTDERKARGWLRSHSKEFDGNIQLMADGVCDFLNMYDGDGNVPVRLVELATEVMGEHK